MKYSIREFLMAAEEEIDAYKFEGEKQRTAFDYKLLGFVREATERLKQKEGYSEEQKGWVALFKDEAEYIEYLRRRDTPVKEDWKGAFKEFLNPALKEDGFIRLNSVTLQLLIDWIETNLISKPLK